MSERVPGHRSSTSVVCADDNPATATTAPRPPSVRRPPLLASSFVTCCRYALRSGCEKRLRGGRSTWSSSKNARRLERWVACKGATCATHVHADADCTIPS